MRKIRKYFHMILTAVICFTVSLFRGKSEKYKYENKEKQTVPSKVNKCGNSIRTGYESSSTDREKNFGYLFFSPGNILQKVFFWLQGPGDRKSQVNYTDFTVCTDTHSRSPDSRTRCNDTVHAAFSQIST